MKVISLGLQCSVPEGIKRANLRGHSYPFDWLWCPSKTTFDILNILVHEGVEKAMEYMTTEFTYYIYHGNEHYTSVDHVTECQMNKRSGLGNTHFTVNDEYKTKLRRRLDRLLNDIKSDVVWLVYADAANPEFNYYLDEVEYGVDATEHLLKIHELIYPLNNNIKMVYFCWHERQKEDNVIQYVPFDFKTNWFGVSEVIKHFLISVVVKLDDLWARDK
jgi:hypothetical protein